jgi:hypothetical protein
MIIVSRGISLRFYRLRSVIDLLTSNVVAKLDSFESYPNCNNNLKTKTFFGIFIILAAVINNNKLKLILSFVNIRYYYLIQAIVRVTITWASKLEDLVNGSSGQFITILFFSSNFLSYITSDAFIFLFYLCYCTIAHYIRLLRAYLLYNSTTRIEPCKGYKELLTHLYKASTALESVFSLPILFVITSKLITVSLYLFTIIYGFVRPNTLFAETSILSIIVEVICSLLVVLCVLHTADLPIHQVGTDKSLIKFCIFIISNFMEKIRQFREEVIRFANNNQLHGDNVDTQHLKVLFCF